MNDFRLTKAASNDIEAIDRYSEAEFGPEHSIAYLSGLRAAFVLLCEHPSIGVPRNDLRRGTRSFPYRRHRIYYRGSADFILVQRVLHHAQMVHPGMFE